MNALSVSPAAHRLDRRLKYAASAAGVAAHLENAVHFAGAETACPDWPLCFGQLVPFFDLPIFLNWAHRVASLVLGLTLLSAWLAPKRTSWPLAAASGLFAMGVALEASAPNRAQLQALLSIGLFALLAVLAFRPYMQSVGYILEAHEKKFLRPLFGLLVFIAGTDYLSYTLRPLHLACQGYASCLVLSRSLPWPFAFATRLGFLALGLALSAFAQYFGSRQRLHPRASSLLRSALRLFPALLSLQILLEFSSALNPSALPLALWATANLICLLALALAAGLDLVYRHRSRPPSGPVSVVHHTTPFANSAQLGKGHS